jgi:hypothetical protein
MGELQERLRRGDLAAILQAADELDRLTAEVERLRAKLELTPENVERVARALCRRPGSLCVGFCHSSRCADAIATFGDDATAAIKALGADQ